jgi:hypothetical protein
VPSERPAIFENDSAADRDASVLEELMIASRCEKKCPAHHQFQLNSQQRWATAGRPMERQRGRECVGAHRHAATA